MLVLTYFRSAEGPLEGGFAPSGTTGFGPRLVPSWPFWALRTLLSDIVALITGDALG